jgi:hypothetical protein
METTNALKAKLALEKLNRANAAMNYTQISDNDDPRISLSKTYNDQMAALTPAERDALLNELDY